MQISQSCHNVRYQTQDVIGSRRDKMINPCQEREGPHTPNSDGGWGESSRPSHDFSAILRKGF